MDFGDALRALKDGQRVTRQVWAGTRADWTGCWVELLPAVKGGGWESMPQLMVGYPDGKVLRPFAGANWDLLAEDWEEVKGAGGDA